MSSYCEVSLPALTGVLVPLAEIDVAAFLQHYNIPSGNYCPTENAGSCLPMGEEVALGCWGDGGAGSREHAHPRAMS